MNIIKAVTSLVFALLIAGYAYAKDELLWLWVTALLVVLGVYLLRNNKNRTIRDVSKISSYLLLGLGVIVAIILIVYFFLMRDFSNSFDR